MQHLRERLQDAEQHTHEHAVHPRGDRRRGHRRRRAGTYPDLSRTYIPVGLAADALGYRVAWDGETSTVIIDDVEAILAENTETYELMDQYTDYADQYSQGTYRVDGSLTLPCRIL